MACSSNGDADNKTPQEEQAQDQSSDKKESPIDSEESNMDVFSSEDIAPSSNEDETEGEDSGNPYVGEIILKVDGEKVTYSETVLYLKYIQAYYETIFGETIWDYDLGEKTIGDLAKEDVIEAIIQRKIAKKQWRDYEVVITEEDEIKIEEASLDYLKNITQDDIKYYAITEEVVYQFFFDNLMAERVYDATTMEVDTNVSDEEAKQITIQYVFINTNKTDNSGNKVPFSEEEKQKAYTDAQELLIEASSAEDFESFANSNSDRSQIEITFGKGEIEQVIEDAAFALNTGEISSIIEGEDGYYILYCVTDYNEDATLQKKEEIIDSNQMEEFQTLFKEWQQDVKIELNEEVWDQLKFD